ncbi:MAG TPA: hypothetical protein VIM08_13690 [Arthrobacter sp.]|jgi:hypothetical protein
MKRAIATLGVAGLGLLTVTAPAFAATPLYICHATSSPAKPYILVPINGNGLNGHDGDTGDIIAPGPLLPAGLNWTATGIETYNNNCVPVVVDPPVVVPPVVDPPVVVPPVVDPPVVVPPVVDPPAVVDQPVTVEQPAVVGEAPAVVTPLVQVAAAAQVPVPQAAAAQVPVAAAAPVSQGTNQGFNAQTAVEATAGSGAPGWLAGLGALLAAGLAVAARRRYSTE